MISVLDKGSVELLNYTHDGDLLVVNAARCSFDKQKEVFDEKDEKLLHYLAKHKHLLPFRHPSATIRITAPIFVFRQLGKHQVGFSWSEVSRRYISSEPEFWVPDEVRKKADNVKQGSSKETLPNAWIVDFQQQNKSAVHTYNTLLRAGTAPEQARAVLPQSMYTTTVTTGTLLGWHHLYTQRIEEHTQKETQEYARAIGELMSNFFPKSWEALNDNI
jgi:thymidylate synthase (FAD)